ncbi:MAG: DUF1064 domain-containing protein [Bacteroidales bacterium]
MKNKFNARKSGKYDSKTEKDRAESLRLMESSGLISDLREQVVFELIPAQYEIKEVQLKTKVKKVTRCVELPCRYIADFVYWENGVQIVEDSKGFKTPEYRIKKKLMLFIHNIKIRETR